MITLKNKNLKDVSDFLLNTVSAKGKKNVDRMRVVNVLSTKSKEVGDEELALLKDFAKLDDEGEIIRKEDGNIDFEDQKGFSEAHKALQEEEFVVEGTNLQSALRSVEKLVNDFDKELSGKQAEAHFLLVDAFENKKTEESDQDGSSN